MVERLDRPRLAIVPAGALRYIPFAALPDSARAEAAPLVERFEISIATSVSVVATLRARGAGPRPDGRLAVIATPGRPLKLRGSTTTSLPWVLEEAEVIAALAGDQPVFSLLGAAATRAAVRGAPLDGYRYVHFATHGLLDDRHGELSGLMLAAEEGRPPSDEDAFLWVRDIYQLDLDADLVVLSACQTALGETVHGEGLVGLVRGFLLAGSDRVLVSLWDVSDRSTARLMEHFYRGLWRRGLSPTAALRRAQLALREEGWSEPYHWAPFVLEGDWGARRTSASAGPPGASKEDD